MDNPWFDPQTGFLILDDYIQELPSFQRIMEDSVITSEELNEQAHRVIAIFHELESRLPDELKPLVTEAIGELSVLYALHRKRLENIR